MFSVVEKAVSMNQYIEAFELIQREINRKIINYKLNVMAMEVYMEEKTDKSLKNQSLIKQNVAQIFEEW